MEANIVTSLFEKVVTQLESAVDQLISTRFYVPIADKMQHTNTENVPAKEKGALEALLVACSCDHLKRALIPGIHPPMVHKSYSEKIKNFLRENNDVSILLDESFPSESIDYVVNEIIRYSDSKFTFRIDSNAGIWWNSVKEELRGLTVTWKNTFGDAGVNYLPMKFSKYLAQSNNWDPPKNWDDSTLNLLRGFVLMQNVDVVEPQNGAMDVAIELIPGLEQGPVGAPFLNDQVKMLAVGVYEYV
jgi:hypothetical protein